MKKSFHQIVEIKKFLSAMINSITKRYSVTTLMIRYLLALSNSFYKGYRSGQKGAIIATYKHHTLAVIASKSYRHCG
jgi:hypothetical protein